MFIDASALVAIIAQEPEAAALSTRLRQAAHRHTSAISVYEAALGLARIGNMPVANTQNLLQRFLSEATVQIVPITAEIGRLAIEALPGSGAAIIRRASTWAIASLMRAPAISV